MLHPRFGRRSCALAAVLLATCALPDADAQLFRRRGGLVRGQPLRNILRVATWPVRAVGRQVFVNGPARRSARRLRGQGLIGPLPGDRWRASRGGYSTGGYHRSGGQVVYSNGSSGYARGQQVAPGVRRESGSSIAQALRNHEHPDRWARIHTVGPDGKPQAFWTYTHPSGTRQWYDPYSRDPETGAPGAWRTEDPHGLTRGFFPTSVEEETPSGDGATTSEGATTEGDAGTSEDPAPAPRPNEGLRTSDGDGAGDGGELPPSDFTEPTTDDSSPGDGKDPGATPAEDGSSRENLQEDISDFMFPTYASLGAGGEAPSSSGETGDAFPTEAFVDPASQDLFADAGAGAWGTTGSPFDTADFGGTGGWDMPGSAGAGSWDVGGPTDTLGGGSSFTSLDSTSMGVDAFASYDSPSMSTGGSFPSVDSDAGAADPFS